MWLALFSMTWAAVVVSVSGGLRLPSGLTHFVVVWRVLGPFVQVMDPARGRRWVRRASFLRDVYVRVVKAKGEDAMAQVEGESCGGCHQQLTPNIMSQLIGATVVFCKTCGRLLYLPEDRTPGRK